MEMILTITKKVPTEQKSMYNGCCLANGEFYFGWKDKSATINPIGQAVQKSILLMNTHTCKSVKLIIQKEFSDSGKEEVLIINKM